MVEKRFSEFCGLVLGYMIGPLTYTISFSRGARTFHPKGIIAHAKVESMDQDILTLHPQALVRFSSAMWKYKTWRDVLGISVRFTNATHITTTPLETDQDLLFASFPHPWQTPIGPFLTRYKDFGKNEFFAVSPFTLNKKQKIIFKIGFESWCEGHQGRSQNLRSNIENHSRLILLYKEESEDWKPLARMTLEKEIQLDQEQLKFNPFLNGLGIWPRGIIHYMRIGAYRFSQAGRSFRILLQKKLNHFNEG